MRSLYHRLRVTIFAAVLLPLVPLTTMPVFGATITVTNTNDSGPGSLRAAIAAASPGDTVKFALACPATITLASPLTISISLKVHGPGASNLAISGGNTVEVFEITAGTVKISRLTIENGFGLGGPVGTSGGIDNAADLTVIGATFSGNFGASGGGIHNAATGTLTVIDSTFSNDSGSPDGGGILNEGTASVTGSVFSIDTAATCGGAVFNSGTITIASSTVTRNTTAEAGRGRLQ